MKFKIRVYLRKNLSFVDLFRFELSASHFDDHKCFINMCISRTRF